MCILVSLPECYDLRVKAAHPRPAALDPEPLSLLLARAGQLAGATLARAVGASGFKRRHGELLMHLASTATVTQQQLQELLGVDPSVLVGLLNDLEAEQLVARVRDTADRRRHIVTLTAQGEAHVREVCTAIEMVERELFRRLPAEDAEQLRRLLAALVSPGADDGPAATTPCGSD